MAVSRRSCLVGAVCLALAGALGCVNPADPFNHEDDFRRLQKRFTAYVRWGKVHEASVFVVAEQRKEFLALAPELTVIRFTDYEITRLDYQDESAHVDVMLRGYRLNAPVEKIVHLAQSWEKTEKMGWQVRLELAELKSGLGHTP
jgi:hypothetical protein